MDAQQEQQLLERVKNLEEQVARLLSPGTDYQTAEAVRQKLIEFVDDIDIRSLQRVLREVSRDSLAGIFVGLPRGCVEKLKKSVSKNSWVEIVNTWEQGAGTWDVTADRKDFLKVMRQLEEMGEIVFGRDAEKFKTHEEWKKHWEEQNVLWEQQRIQREIEQKTKREEAKLWFRQTVADLA